MNDNNLQMTVCEFISTLSDEHQERVLRMFFRDPYDPVFTFVVAEVFTLGDSPRVVAQKLRQCADNLEASLQDALHKNEGEPA